MAEVQFRQALISLGIVPTQILGILTRRTAKLSARGRISLWSSIMWKRNWLRSCVSEEDMGVQWVPRWLWASSTLWQIRQTAWWVMVVAARPTDWGELLSPSGIGKGCARNTVPRFGLPNSRKSRRNWRGTSKGLSGYLWEYQMWPLSSYGRGHKLWLGRFSLDMGEKDFTGQVVQHWHRSSREVVEYTSFEVFKT